MIRTVLAIESSCDETSVAVVENGRQIRSNIVSSQLQRHQPFGGVVPELAARCHLESFLPVIRQALTEANCGPDAIDLIAGTYGPGLIGGLLVGLTAAKGLALAWGKPFIGVNHIEGHIFANILAHQDIQPPLVCLTVSGGHTDLLYWPSFGRYQVLGRTRDDAAGEAFDKVSRVMGMGYPGGPAIDALAKQGRPVVPLVRGDGLASTYDFSFSGLKTAVINLLHRGGKNFVPPEPPDLAASFQAAVVEQLADRTFRAVKNFHVKTVLLSGGVAANSALRNRFLEEGSKVGASIYYPPVDLCTDNAAMIAAAGYYRYTEQGPSGLDLPAVPNLKLG
ncbi:MAG TPA: tRNA (adenosine(37)-N6)-threonylcarbamoyltransferase complex transferase subunit TsaD [Bacillota bacterium]|nr:tRNA (adenosine(37)-N6)-threonylcarbamoyltransferase complex transferase subunit TsaD [Bacillota bacterium]